MELRELTRSAFAAWNARRFDEVLEYFHEDAVWDMTPFGLPGVGEYRGHKGLLRFFDDWLEAFPDSSIAVEDVEAWGKWTFAVVVQQVTGSTSQTPVPFKYGGIGRWEDERLAFVQNYPELDQGRAAFEQFVSQEQTVDAPV